MFSLNPINISDNHQHHDIHHHHHRDCRFGHRTTTILTMTTELKRVLTWHQKSPQSPLRNFAWLIEQTLKMDEPNLERLHQIAELKLEEVDSLQNDLRTIIKELPRT